MSDQGGSHERKESCEDIEKFREGLKKSLSRAGEAAKPIQEGITKLKEQKMSVKSKGLQVVSSIKKRKQAILDLWAEIMNEQLDQAEKSIGAKLTEIEGSIRVCEEYLSRYLTEFSRGKSLLAVESPDQSDIKKIAEDLEALSASPSTPTHVSPLRLVYGNMFDLHDAESSLRSFAGSLFDIEEKMFDPPGIGIADYCLVPASGLLVTAATPKSGIWKEVKGEMEEVYGVGAGGLSVSSDGKKLYATVVHQQKVNIFDIQENGHLELKSHVNIKGAKSMQGIDVRSDGCLAIVDYGVWRVTIHEPNGTLKTEIQAGDRGHHIFTEPVFVKWASDNSVYVTDRIGIKHVQIDPVRILWQTPIASAWKVHVGKNSKLYVTIYHSSETIVLSNRGEIMNRFDCMGTFAVGMYTSDCDKEVLVSYSTARNT